MHNSSSRILFPHILTLASALSCAAAEPASPDGRHFPDLRVDPVIETSYSSGGDLGEGSVGLGDMTALMTRVAVPFRIASSERFEWSTGIEWQRWSFGLPQGAAVPNSLQTVNATIGAQWNFADSWTARVELQPGVYSDFEDISGGDFNAPGKLGLIWKVNPTLQLVAQVGVDVRRSNPVLGGIGARWQFADDWTLSLLLPRPQLEYRLVPSTTLFAGASILGGTFRVADDLGTRTGRPELNSQDLEYREIRIGAGVRTRLGDRVTLQAEGGWAVDRRFHYDDANLLLNGDGAPYVGASLSVAF